MRKFLKVWLPPFVGFAVFFIGIRYSSLYFTLHIDEMGEGNLKSFMAYYRYFLPLLFIVGVLTQYLIIIPAWNKAVYSSVTAKIISFITLCLVCLLLAAGLAYIIWEKPTGTYRLIKLCLFMAAVQITYWLINISVLYLLQKKRSELPEKEESDPAA